MRRFLTLERTRAKMEILYRQSKVARRDVEHIYGAVFLTAFASFEGMIEELFLRMLARRVSIPAKVRPKTTFRSSGVARDIVFGGRHYVDWVPYERTTERAELFFSGGRPFSNLDQNERRIIHAACIVRNAIAHQGRHARQQFNAHIVSRYTLAPRERTPAGFLRSLHSSAPNITRYEELVSELAVLARKLVA